MKAKEIPIDQITTADNIRFESDGDLGDMMESIEQQGLLQPIVVAPKGDKFVVVVGHRRFAAMKARNEATVPCVIRDDIADGERVVLQLIENGQRRQMSASEYVDAFEKLRKKNPSYTRSKIATLIGRHPSWVTNQYQAVRLGAKMVSDGDVTLKEAESLTAGQIIGRAQRKGIYGVKPKHGAKDITASMINSTTVSVRCRDAAVVAMLLEAIDRIRKAIIKEDSQL